MECVSISVGVLGARERFFFFELSIGLRGVLGILGKGVMCVKVGLFGVVVVFGD